MVIHSFKNQVLVTWPATNFLIIIKMVRVWRTESLLFCLRDDPLTVFRRQNHVTFIFIKTMSHDLLVQVTYFIEQRWYIVTLLYGSCYYSHLFLSWWNTHTFSYEKTLSLLIRSPLWLLSEVPTCTMLYSFTCLHISHSNHVPLLILYLLIDVLILFKLYLNLDGPLC